MARRRAFTPDLPEVPDVDQGHGLGWSGANRARMRSAAWHGFRDDSRRDEWDPPEGWDRQPSRAWAAAFYLTNRELFLAHWRERPTVFLACWPVAQFEPVDEWRERAAAAVEAHRVRMGRLRRDFARRALEEDGRRGRPGG